MGQLSKDWAELKAIIKQKDDAIDKQAGQIAALQKQIAAQTPQLLDTDDQKAVAELRQTVGDNTPGVVGPTPATPASPAPVPAPAPALSHPATPVHPPTTPVTTFKK